MSQSARTSRLGLYIPFILAGLAIIIHGVYWVFVSGQIRAGAEGWIEDQRQAGYTIAYEDLGVGGYPFRFTLRVEQPRIQAPARDGGWSVDLERLAGSAQFYSLNHWILTPGGPAHVEVPDGGEPLRLRLEAESARLSVRSAGGATTRLGASVTALDIVSESGPRPSIQRIDQLDVSGLVTDEDALLAALMGEGIVIAEGELDSEISGTFGETINKVQLNASMTAFSALIQGGSPASWRGAGGTIHIEGAGLVWGPADLFGDGELTLDDELMVEGRLSVGVIDPETLITALVDGAMVEENQGEALRLAALMAPRTEGRITLSLHLRNGGVYFGPARLGSFATSGSSETETVD